MTLKNVNEKGYAGLTKLVSNGRFQRIFVVIVTVLAAFILIENASAPKKYKLNLEDKSPYDITAPKDIVNKDRVEAAAVAARDNVQPVIRQDDAAVFDMFRKVDNFISATTMLKKNITKNLEAQGIQKEVPEYAAKLKAEEDRSVTALMTYAQNSGFSLTAEQSRYIITQSTEEEMISFKNFIMDALNSAVKGDINEDNLQEKIQYAQNDLEDSEMDNFLKETGVQLIKSILRPVRVVDREMTESKQKEAYKAAYDEASKTERILKGERIISFGDIVTQDKLNILSELNLLDRGVRLDLRFASGTLILVLLLSAILIFYLNIFLKKAVLNSQSVLLLSLIILMMLIIVRAMSTRVTSLAIPILILPMLVSILFNLRLGIVVNMMMTIAVSLMINGDARFIYMSLISGSAAAFLVSRANQRSKLSAAGVIAGLTNVIIIVSIGIISKNELNAIAADSSIVFFNGVVSSIVTIGLLPFIETVFDVITPLKLLELVNPNQPLLKRLLMEAPGTYHHSLMVGNLAEAAIEEIGGNALLARAGAYFHDIGKLTRPYFFKENQMNGNPHDRMTANLSTLVITSHIKDGIDMAVKHKIPMAIQQIISQHHGTTLVAYFYHKAVNIEKGENINPENFRYEGPKPTSREAAVVMLADSVEAAVKSMSDKSRGKIEGQVRKIIKEKLDDGQFDQSDLTLKDLDTIANAFLKVLSGIFHEREEYPEINLKKDLQTVEVEKAGSDADNMILKE